MVHMLGLYITAGMAGLAGLLYLVLLLPPRVPIVLPHSVSFAEQVSLTLGPRSSDTDRGRGIAHSYAFDLEATSTQT